MENNDACKVRRFDTLGRRREFTDIVYNENQLSRDEIKQKISEAKRKYYPEAPALSLFVGEMHGHTNLSDGRADIDSYFKNIRDVAKLDFGAVTDHDHGGLGSLPLWGGDEPKWNIIKRAVAEYYEPGKFTTLLAYERDSYPFFNNMILYFRNGDANMLIDEYPGEISEALYKSILESNDVIPVPHDTYSFSSGADFIRMDKDLIPPLMEIISRSDAAEYMGNPAFEIDNACEGGFYQDALRRGAKIGCIGGSDDHSIFNCRVAEEYGYPRMYPGVSGVWAKENTREAIFDALAAKRCYAFMLGKSDGEMGGRIEIDFRINGHWMGESISRGDGERLNVYFHIKADSPVKTVTLVKNCRDYIKLPYGREVILDYNQELPTDSYYLRVELKDGRFGWTSPVWVDGNPNSF